MCRLDMEVDRLFCDDGVMLPWWPTAGKAQRDRLVQGCAANGQHAGSRIRQGGGGTVVESAEKPMSFEGCRSGMAIASH